MAAAPSQVATKDLQQPTIGDIPVKNVELLDNNAAATLLCVQPNTLEIWRTKGLGPPFVKMGASKQSAVRYVKSVVEDWLTERLFSSTSAYAPTATHKFVFSCYLELNV